MKSLCLKLACLSLALLACFGLSRTAKAAIIYSDLNKPWEASNIITIPEHSLNSAIFCTGIFNGTTATYTFTINGVSASFLTSQNSGGAGESVQIAYITNIPEAGSYAFTESLPSTRYDGRCVLLDNVDTTNLIEDISGTIDSQNITATSTSGNYAIILGAAGNGGNGYTGVAINNQNFDIFSTYSWNGQKAWFSGGQIATSSTINFSFSEAGSASFWGGREKIIKINAYQAPTNQAYWAGVGSQYLAKNQNNQVPFYYNFCANYDNIKSASFIFSPILYYINSYNKDVIIDKNEFIGPQKCSGLMYATIKPQTLFTPATGSFDQYVGFNITYYDDTTEFVATNFNYTTENNSGNYLENAIVEPLTIDLDNSTSTDYYFNYDFTGLISTTTPVCAYWSVLGSSNNCVNISPSSPVGYGYINIPNPSTTGTIQLGFSADSLNLKSKTKKIIYTSKFKNASSTLGILADPHDLACSASEWADSNWWTAIRCSTIEAGYRGLNNIQLVAESIVSGLGDMFSTFFPVNIPVQINNSWENSASTTMPTELAFLEIGDGSGNVYIPFPKELTGNASDTELLIWGPALFTPVGSKSAAGFAHVKVLSKYIIWITLIVATIYLAKKILKKLMPGAEEKPDI